MRDFLVVIGAVVVFIPFIFALSLTMLLWRAWWLYPAWGWYLVPLGLPPISFWHFTALVFLVGVLTQHMDTKEDDRKTSWGAVFVSFFWPAIIWAILRWLR